MGKGDMKTKRGKIHKGTYGKHRPRKVHTAAATAAPEPVVARKKTKKA
jgi:ribosomal small subunit protein bTHX